MSGNSYVLVATDYFTCWVEAYPISNQEAGTEMTEFFFRFSPPARLHSDQGRNFEADVNAEICKILHIMKTRTTPYHPQSDGLVEWFNQTLLSMFSTASRDNPNEWGTHLRHLCMVYNTSLHPTTGYSPFYLMFGCRARLPTDIMYGTPTPEAVPVTEYV